MSPSYRLPYLMQKYLHNQCTPVELEELTLLLNEAEDDELDAQLRTLWEQQGHQPIAHPVDWNRIRAEVEQIDVAAVHWRPRPMTRWRRWTATAAAAILVALAGTWIFFFGDIRHQTSDIRLAATEILPGGNRATLTLADGRVVNLSSEQSGIVLGDGITYTDGSLVISPESEDRSPKIDRDKDHLPTSDSRLLTLATPKGGTYQITLPDGTKVWLNAASTLKYPSRFDDKERVVELTGEAYFEVRKLDSSSSAFQPFKVITQGQTVEVLGTEFNISAYPDEPETKTTLVEGKVKVVAGAPEIAIRNTQYIILSPGQQAITREAATDIQKVETAQFIAWKNGFFNFDASTFEQAMRQLERWYDIEVSYEGGVPDNVTLRGKMERNLSLQTVLDILKRLNLNYRIQGRKLIIVNK